MAIIPTYQQDTQQNAPGAQAAENPQASAIAGKSIEEGATGLFNYGEALARQQKAKASLEAKQAEDLGKIAGMRLADDRQRKVIANTDRSGKNAVTDFDTGIAEDEQAFLESMGDSSHKSTVSIAFKMGTLQSRSELSAIATGMFKENAAKNNILIKRGITYEIDKNPATLQTKRTEYRASLKHFLDNELISQEEAAKEAVEADKDFALAAIRSSQKYGTEAGFRQSLQEIEGFAGSLLSAEDRADERDKARNAGTAAEKFELSMNDRAKRDALSMVEAKQVEVQRKLFTTQEEIDRLPEGRDKAAMIIEQQRLIQRLQSKGDLTPEKAATAYKMAVDKLEFSQEKVVAPYYRRIHSEGNLNRILGDIEYEYRHDYVKYSEFKEITKAVERERDRREAQRDKHKADPMVNKTLDALEDRLPSTIVNGSFKANPEAKNALDADFYRILDSGKYGRNLIKIRDIIAAKHLRKKPLSETNNMIEGWKSNSPTIRKNIMDMPDGTPEQKTRKFKAKQDQLEWERQWLPKPKATPSAKGALPPKKKVK